MEDFWKTLGRLWEACRRRAGRRWTGISGSFRRGFLGEDFWGNNFLRMEKSGKYFGNRVGRRFGRNSEKQNQPREWGGDPDGIWEKSGGGDPDGIWENGRNCEKCSQPVYIHYSRLIKGSDLTVTS